MSFRFKIISIDLSLSPEERTALGLGPGDPEDAVAQVIAANSYNGIEEGVAAFAYPFVQATTTPVQLLSAIQDNSQSLASVQLNAVPSFTDLVGREFTFTPLGVTNVTVLPVDVVNAGANVIEDATGLAFQVIAGRTYWFRFVAMFTTAALTTGSRWSVSGPASPTSLVFSTRVADGATTSVINNGLSAYDTPATATAGSVALDSNMAIVEGFITPSLDGEVVLRFASEIGGSAITAKAGSMVSWSLVL